MYEHTSWTRWGGYIARTAGKRVKIYLWYGNTKGRNHLEDRDAGLHRGAYTLGTK